MSLAQIDSKSITEQQKAEATRQFSEKLRDKLLNTDEAGVLWRIANSDMTEGNKITHLFLSIVGRRPTPQEARQSIAILRAGAHLSGLRDIGYILITSREFAVQR